ncbi:MAG: transposase [Candidatus Cloacimonetes bacterium]|nr:transposase [Candidatus Cloacimonadota bacterium]
MRSSYKFSEYGTELYFLTFTIVEWIPVFIRQKYCDIIVNNLQFYRKEQGLKIHYLVIMPEHIHIIVSSENDVRKIIQNFKSYTAKEIIQNLKHDKRKWILNLLKYYKKKHKSESEYQVWQEGSHPEIITSTAMLNQKINYIHFNPVKAGFVTTPEQWRYSSAGYYDGNESIMEFDEITL